MKATDAIKKLLPFPGIDAKPVLHRESRYIPTKRGTVKACLFRLVYHVDIESFYESGNYESWITIRTGDRSSPEAAMKEWNRLVRRVKKG